MSFVAPQILKNRIRFSIPQINPISIIKISIIKNWVDYSANVYLSINLPMVTLVIITDRLLASSPMRLYVARRFLIRLFRCGYKDMYSFGISESVIRGVSLQLLHYGTGVKLCRQRTGLSLGNHPWVWTPWLAGHWRVSRKCTFDVQKFVYNVPKSMYKNVFSRRFLSSCVALDAG